MLLMKAGCVTPPPDDASQAPLVPEEFANRQLEPGRLSAPLAGKREDREPFVCIEEGKTIDTSGLAPLDTSFIEMDIREALLEISMATEVPIVVGEEVQGFVTAVVSGTNLENALDILLAPGGFAFKKFQNYILVGSQQPGSPSLALLSDTCRFSPRYSQVADIVAMLNSNDQKFVRPNEGSNTIAVTAPPQTLERLKRTLLLLDRAVDQVLLEVSIVEINREVFDNLGIHWGQLTNVIERGVDFGADIVVTKELLGRDDHHYNYPYHGAFGYSRARNVGHLQNFIGILKSRGDADINAMPSIMTLSGKEANFASTETAWLPFNGGNSVGGYSSNRNSLEYGVNLKLIPHIRSNDTIRLEIVNASVSDLTVTGVGEPTLISHSVSNTVEVSNGDMVVLGGLLQKKNNQANADVPGLSKILGINRLFSQQKLELKEIEVLVLIRPTIIQPIAEGRGGAGEGREPDE